MATGIAAILLSLFFVVLSVTETLAQEKNSTYKSDGKRDPFVPLISSSGYLVNLEPEDDSTLRLEGIMFDPKGDSVAIINGGLYRVGETINDAIVSTIEADKVILIKDNQKIEILLREES